MAVLRGVARLAITAPRRIIAAAVLVLVAAGIFGIPVVNRLSAGGFQDPTSESARATELLRDKFGQTDQKMLIALTAPAGAHSGEARQVGTDIVDRETIAVGHRRLFGVDIAASDGGPAGQQGR